MEDIGALEIKLTNRLSALCFPCTQSALRGWSNPVGAMSEIAFYRLEGQSDSDVEIQAHVLTTLMKQTGLSREELLARLSRTLPDAVDKYTPDGTLPQANPA